MNRKLKIYHSSLISIRKPRGFTLIELLIVISITALLGVSAIAGFSSYNSVQALQTSASNVVAMLNLARSRAQSQIKPSGCASNLNGYRVVISTSGEYVLYVSCSGTNDQSGDTKITEEYKQLPSGVTFSAGSSLFLFFPAQTGGVQGSTGSSPWYIVINSSGKTRTITINALGGISVSQ